jgi:hypothetical protein
VRVRNPASLIHWQLLLCVLTSLKRSRQIQRCDAAVVVAAFFR